MPRPKKTKASGAQRKKSGPNRTPTLRDRAFSPAIDEFAEALKPAGGDVGHLLRELTEQATNWLRARLKSRFEATPKDKRVEPNPRILIPAIQGLAYSYNEETIRNMFAALLAADMNTETKPKVHPSFVELIKEMTPLDAKIIAYIKNNGDQALFTGQLSTVDMQTNLEHALSFTIGDDPFRSALSAIVNLSRLGLLEKRDSHFPTGTGPALEEYRKVFIDRFNARAKDPEFVRKAGLVPPAQLRVVADGLFLTAFGHDFVAVCFET